MNEHMYKRTYKLVTKKIRKKRDKTCRDTFEILEKRGRACLPSMIPEVFPYRHNFYGCNQYCDTRLYERLKKKMYFAKESNASYDVKKEYNM